VFLRPSDGTEAKYDGSNVMAILKKNQKRGDESKTGYFSQITIPTVMSEECVEAGTVRWPVTLGAGIEK